MSDSTQHWPGARGRSAAIRPLPISEELLLNSGKWLNPPPNLHGAFLENKKKEANSKARKETLFLAFLAAKITTPS